MGERSIRTPCWVCGADHNAGHCRRSQAVKDLSDKMLAQWIVKHLSGTDPFADAEFLSVMLTEFRRQIEASRLPQESSGK